MTYTTQELLDKHQIRKNKAQKAEFLKLVKAHADKHGYACSTEKGSFGAQNIIVGDVRSAKLIYTAHYDTCAVTPFPNLITPKNMFLYLLYQIAIVAAFFAVSFFVGYGTGYLFSLANIDLDYETLYFISLGVYFALFALLLFGPANKHTANDNTSGVATLLDIMAALPDADKGKIAFVFFDLEESGTIGSSSFAKAHKAEMRDKLLLNFDCVSDGDRILLAVKKKAADAIPLLKEHFTERGKFKVDIRSKGVFYPSDQANFDRGVGIATLKYSKLFKTEYMNRIHTSRDVIFEEENIEYLVECATSLAAAIQ